MSKPFKCKQFTVNQDRCAMKIGTDGILLGAWTPLNNNPCSILDIGAGTGIISLIMAQRSNAELVDAIEIDENAYEQCVGNFEASPWGDRLFCYHAGLDEFVDEIDDTYDLIVCNPPFYTEVVTTGNKQRDLARQNSFLPFDELLQGVSILLSEAGSFTVIIPFKEEIQFIAIAKKIGLFPSKITRVKGNTTSEVKRSLLEISKKEMTVEIRELIIEKERHVYTEEYINLTRDFYLKM
ncbi:tRNA1(Val) (adenine(37)-N6)-methyltransferase [Maribacter sp. CXY002]|uniref:tRNA1(Val) (adenine(37)-N6)-methyltransferase n=1 Tax=Maribacter luteocoastalis TaxID=3407671 RepID=UPI003B67AE64